MNCNSIPLHTHPFGYIFTNNARQYGYLPISKCGSTTLSSSFQQTNAVRFDEINQKYVFSILRDPLERFLSSIPETLSRFIPASRNLNSLLYTSKSPNIKLSKYSKVKVNNVIYNKLLSMSIDDLPQLLEEYILILSEYGFFDAHHLPYKYFFSSISEDSYLNIYCVPINYLTPLLKSLGNVKESGIVINIENQRKSIISDSNTSKFKILGRDFKNRTKLIVYILKYGVKFTNHPLLRINQKNKSLATSNYKSNPSLSTLSKEFYDEVLRSSLTAKFLEIFNDLYYDDIKAWNLLCQHQKTTVDIDDMFMANQLKFFDIYKIN